MSSTAEREPPSRVAAETLARLRQAVGEKGYTCDPDEIAPHCVSWRDNWVGKVPMVVRPANTDEVAAVVRICAETGTPIVPQGGNTGVTGASQPHDDGSEIILSTSRMNRVREIDLLNDTITVEAGCVLADIQAKADEVERLFPLSLGAEGSCQIGGNLSTNAGGTQVLRYGNTRNLVLGVEVVLADGRVWNGLRGLRKDNTGYDLKQLFIGAEGTLGIITAAVLRLLPKPTDRVTAIAAVPDPATAAELLARARTVFGEQVTSFELMQRVCIDMDLAHVPGTVDPLADRHDWYVLIEVGGQGAPGTLRETVEDFLGAAAEASQVLDATIAASEAQADALWKLRDAVAEAQNHFGASIKHDVSVPLSRVPEFISRATEALEAAYPGIRIVAFGHLGDGNIHFNPAGPVDMAGEAFAAERATINRIVHDIVVELSGSISAEHGLGRLRREEARHYKPAIEMELMERLKRALDPDQILNPGKVI